MTSELSKYLEVNMKGKQTKKGINKKTKQKEPLVYTQSFDALQESVKLGCISWHLV
jgi:hypothetical protein